MTSLSLNNLYRQKCEHGNPKATCPECRAEAKEAERQRKAEEAQAEAERIRQIQEHPENWLRQFGVPKKFLQCSFQNFQGGEKVKDVLQTVAGKDVLLSGSAGCGKTHLAVATLRHRLPEIAGLNVLFATAPEILLSIRSCFSKNSDEKALVDQFTARDLLIIDDLGADKATEWAVQTLYLIIDYRNREMRPTVITSNLGIQEIENQYGARIASRLADMTVISLKMPDYRKLRKKGV